MGKLSYEIRTKDGSSLVITWSDTSKLFRKECRSIEDKAAKMLQKLANKIIQMNKKEYRKRRIAEIDKEIQGRLNNEWIGG